MTVTEIIARGAGTTMGGAEATTAGIIEIVGITAETDACPADNNCLFLPSTGRRVTTRLPPFRELLTSQS